MSSTVSGSGEAFLDLVHLAAALADPKSEHPAADRLRAALPAALAAIGNATDEELLAFIKSARAAGLRLKGNDEEIARLLRSRASRE